MGMLDMIEFKYEYEFYSWGTNWNLECVIDCSKIRICNNKILIYWYEISETFNNNEEGIDEFIKYLETTFELPKEELHETLLKIMILNK